MRIYDVNSDKRINDLILYLTPDEAQEMKESLELLIGDSDEIHHVHISDIEGNFVEREITVCIYREDNLSSFDQRSQKLILDDE